MGGACSIKGKDEECIQNIGRENLKGRDQSDKLGVDGKIILKWISGK
jgi:hypothetical protein